MVSRWCNSTRGVLLLALSLASCFTRSSRALTEHERADENTTLPETTSLQGTLQGVNMVTRNNRPIYGFKGIPYAEPPVGDLRFKATVAAGKWNGTFSASRDSPLCPQIADEDVTIVGDEDCLYLHVYTPKLPESDNSTLLPVIVYIYGGLFEFGNCNPVSHGPNFLLDKDVLLVVPNFRLGVLGYLTTGDEVSPGNYGLKDIVLALRWVQDNIQYFGGDPNQVTLAGDSSGSMSVIFLSIADSTSGLFHKIIADSGSVFDLEVTPPVEVHVNHTIQLAESFGCPTNSSILLISCLRRLSATQLIKTTSLFLVWQTFPRLIWFPTTEPDIEGALLTDTPANLFAAGKVRDVPWISLLTRTEGLFNSVVFYEDADLFEEFLNKIDLILPYFLGYYWKSVDTVTAYTTALKSYYLNNLTVDRSVLLNNVTDMIGDAMFNYPTYHSLQQQLVTATNPLYFTCFAYRGVFSFTYFLSKGNTNYTEVTHADDTIYIFGNPGHIFGPPDYEYSEADWSMVDTMVELWTSFAITGTPSIVNANNTTIWEPYSSLKNYLRIGNGSDRTIGMEYDLYKERMKFWAEMTSPTSGESQNQLQLLTILSCLALLTVLSLQR